jgi:hypothetical protein
MITNKKNRPDLVITFWMMFWYIAYCFKFRVDPWKFFQLNADYFNKKLGIYSKLEINQLIPFQWRLKQWVHDRSTPPQRYPVFLKPEWGQNSYGIYRADSPQEFEVLQEVIADKEITYVLQEAAEQSLEFEVYYIRQVEKPDTFASFTITEVENTHEEKLPINGKNNIHTAYRDRTQSFTEDETQIIWNHVKKIGNFRMARVCMKADSKTDLLQGNFHIVEINLFTPMPLNLLDPKTPWPEKAQFIRAGMFFLAENTRAISAKQERKSIFFKKLAMHYRVKS